MTDIKMGEMDAALIIRADGTEQVITPKMPDNEVAPVNVAKIVFAAYAIHDDEVCEFIEKRIEKFVKS